MSTKRGRGRPRKITLDIILAIGKRIAKGMTEEQACMVADVSHGSFRSAVARNPEFSAAVKKEQAAFLDRALTAIADGGEVEPGADGKVRVKQWTGLAWILERRHKPQFNRVEGHAVTDTAGEGLTLSDVEMQELEKMGKARVKREAK